MAIGTALPGFNDLGRSVIPIFLLMDHFLYRRSTFSEKVEKNYRLEATKCLLPQDDIFCLTYPSLFVSVLCYLSRLPLSYSGLAPGVDTPANPSSPEWLFSSSLPPLF